MPLINHNFVNNIIALFILKFCTMIIWLILFGYIIGYFNGDHISTYFFWLFFIGQLAMSAIWSFMLYFMYMLFFWSVTKRKLFALVISYILLYTLELLLSNTRELKNLIYGNNGLDIELLGSAIFGMIFSCLIFIQLYKVIGSKIIKRPSVLP